MIVNNLDSFDFFIYPREVTPSKCLSLPNIGAMILDAAGLAAARRGFGMNDMHSRGLAWVVSRMAMKIVSLPEDYTNITIKTWIKECGVVASDRAFVVFDENENLICSGSSLWSIIDLTSRRVVNLQETTNLSQYICCDYVAAIPETKRVDFPKSADVTEHLHHVVYSDLDMNCHVNSMKYLQWALDCLPLDFHNTRKVTACDINFTKEALLNQNIRILQTKVFDGAENQSYCFCLKNDNDIITTKIKLTYV